MNKLEVCLSPLLIANFSVQDKYVVIVDILRATSTITSALSYGIEAILPVEDIETCLKWKEKGYLTAGERNGKKIPDFDLGNSPFHFHKEELIGKKIVMTTTNGTRAIHLAQDASKILLGSFLNLNALSSFLINAKKDVIILCAGWKGKVNLEDTLFAGALAEYLMPHFTNVDDATLAAVKLFDVSKNNLKEALRKASHIQRLKNLNIEKDVTYCLSTDKSAAIPVLDDNGWLVEMSKNK